MLRVGCVQRQSPEVVIRFCGRFSECQALTIGRERVCSHFRLALQQCLGFARSVRTNPLNAMTAGNWCEEHEVIPVPRPNETAVRFPERKLGYVSSCQIIHLNIK